MDQPGQSARRYSLDRGPEPLQLWLRAKQHGRWLSDSNGSAGNPLTGGKDFHQSSQLHGLWTELWLVEQCDSRLGRSAVLPGCSIRRLQYRLARVAYSGWDIPTLL